MAYMQVLSDGRVVPQTSLPERMWMGKFPHHKIRKQETARKGNAMDGKTREEIDSFLNRYFRDSSEYDREQAGKEIAKIVEQSERRAAERASERMVRALSQRD